MFAEKLRHTLEVFSPLHGEEMGPVLEQLRSVLTLLSSTSDCRTARAVISRMGGFRKLEESLRRKQRRKADEFVELWSERFSDPATSRDWLNRLTPAGRALAANAKPMVRAADAGTG